MLFFRSNPLFLLLLSLFLFFSSSHGNSQLPSLYPKRFPEVLNEREYGGVANLTIRRSVAENVKKPLLILAANRTVRRDPLNGFKRYTGGWNLTNQHYWASVGFTAAPLFAIAAVWFIVFGISLFCVAICCCCCSQDPYGYSRACYALSLIFLILFTIAAILGCVVLYTGQGKFHSQTTDSLNYVLNQAKVVGSNLWNISDYLSAAKRIGISSVYLPKDLQNTIDDVDKKIKSVADLLNDQTGKNSKRIHDKLEIVRKALIAIAAIMLFLAFLGFLFSILGLQCLVYVLVILGWILVTGTFILCGVFLLLHNVVADTCVSMEEWVQNPTAHTALSRLLPCVDNSTAQEIYYRTQDVTTGLVFMVDGVITNVSNSNFPPGFGPLYYNQSGPLVPVLCQPFNADYTERECAPGEVHFDNATQVWKNYVCQVSESGICTTPGRLTPNSYNQISAAVNVSYVLYRYSPFLIDIIDCTFVRKTFTDISQDLCPGLRLYSKWIYVGLVMVSGAVMLSLIFWIIYARERQHRVYTKQFMYGPPGAHFGYKAT